MAYDPVRAGPRPGMSGPAPLEARAAVTVARCVPARRWSSAATRRRTCSSSEYTVDIDIDTDTQAQGDAVFAAIRFRPGAQIAH